MRRPKLIIHYAPPPTPLPDGSYIATRTYCGVEDRSTTVPATSVAVYGCDCLACLRAYHAMWGGAEHRIRQVKRNRARAAAFLDGRDTDCDAHDRQIPAALCTCDPTKAPL